MQNFKLDRTFVKKSTLQSESTNDWQGKSFAEKIAAIEFLRQQHHGSSPRLQRVYRIIKRS